MANGASCVGIAVASSKSYAEVSRQQMQLSSMCPVSAAMVIWRLCRVHVFSYCCASAPVSYRLSRIRQAPAVEVEKTAVSRTHKHLDMMPEQTPRNIQDTTS